MYEPTVDHSKSKKLEYYELETAHTKDPIKAKSTNDPNIFFSSYEDFPPDFYKAEYYPGYNAIALELNSALM